MSKKTNIEKQKRKYLRKPRGVKGKRTKVPNIDTAAVFNGCVDLALGQLFVQALRGTGLRDKLVEIIFSEEDEPLAGTDSRAFPDSPKGPKGRE